jgi:hypothetical protein
LSASLKAWMVASVSALVVAVVIGYSSRFVLPD